MKKNRDLVCFNQFLLILPWSFSWFQHGTQTHRAADREEICLINLFWIEHSRESFRMQTGFMDNMLSMFPPRPESLPCPGPKRCQVLVQRVQPEKGWTKFPVFGLVERGKRQGSHFFSSIKRITDTKLCNCISSEASGASFRLASVLLIHRKYLKICK